MMIDIILVILELLNTVGHEYIKNIWFMRRISALRSVTVPLCTSVCAFIQICSILV